ncbi:MAG TPA: Gfo/Idh/MocA family oxidoreductase [Microbacterium sp.]|nr:Gfo/Idh/MocA family oxidoreductase [Microbacterium sp.]
MINRPAAFGWAILGTGTVSHSVAADLSIVDGVRRVGVWSRSAKKAASFATTHRFERAFTSIEDVLAAPDIDIVYIATPHATHARLAIASLEAGKHVLVEKPIGVNADEARAIARAAEANDRFAMEAMWMRFAPAYIALREDIAAGALGDISGVRAAFGLPFGHPESERWTSELRSSTLLDQAIYAVTLARDVLGEPLNVTSEATVRADGVDLTLHATLGYAGGRFAQLAASMVTYLEPTAAVSGTNGWATIAPPFWATDRYRLHAGDLGEAFGEPTDRVFPQQGFGYVPMLRAVHEALSEGATQHPHHPLSDSVAVLQTLDTIRSEWTATAAA